MHDSRTQFLKLSMLNAAQQMQIFLNNYMCIVCILIETFKQRTLGTVGLKHLHIFQTECSITMTNDKTCLFPVQK